MRRIGEYPWTTFLEPWEKLTGAGLAEFPWLNRDTVLLPKVWLAVSVGDAGGAALRCHHCKVLTWPFAARGAEELKTAERELSRGVFTMACDLGDADYVAEAAKALTA